MGHGVTREMQRMLEDAEKRGWIINWKRRRGSHYKCFYHGRLVVVSCTPKYPRAVLNARADMRRVEREVNVCLAILPRRL